MSVSCRGPADSRRIKSVRIQQADRTPCVDSQRRLPHPEPQNGVSAVPPFRGRNETSQVAQFHRASHAPLMADTRWGRSKRATRLSAVTVTATARVDTAVGKPTQSAPTPTASTGRATPAYPTI
jgi:hypothetical protein